MEKKGILVASTLVDPGNNHFSIVNVLDRLKLNSGINKTSWHSWVKKCFFMQSFPLTTWKSTVFIWKIIKNWLEEQKPLLFDLSISYKDIFVGPDGKFGRTHIVKYTVDKEIVSPLNIKIAKNFKVCLNCLPTIYISFTWNFSYPFKTAEHNLARWKCISFEAFVRPSVKTFDVTMKA